MSIEIFTQLSATGDQLEQQYALRHRFCIDQLGWTDRNSVRGMEYDQYDHPAAIYIIYRHENTARAMMRIAQCDLPYMLKDHWPSLIGNGVLPSTDRQWELTRLCVEKSLGEERRKAIAMLCSALESIAQHRDIEEYWWVGPKHRIETMAPHNRHYVGEGQLIGSEFCFTGYCDALNMVKPEARKYIETKDAYAIRELAA
jgi:N-acyl-L-homoserine lactone synthetase